MAQAQQIIKEAGYVLKMDPVIYENDFYLSGPDEVRLSQMQQALDSPHIRAILCARGGYGTTRILDSLDFSTFLKHPKWICGFSDITSLHLKMHQLGAQSIHSTMPLLMGRNGYEQGDRLLLETLQGRIPTLDTAANPQNIAGIAQAPVVGGNLSLLCESLGTSTELTLAGKILLVEEVDEYRYKVDRMWNQLKRAGKLNGLKGVVVGCMTQINDTAEPFGYDFHQIIRRYTQELGIPVGFGFPIGHEAPNLPCVMGHMYRLEVEADGSRLTPL
jgi:muramoyltetrapeptide carboxypeptidase